MVYESCLACEAWEKGLNEVSWHRSVGLRTHTGTHTYTHTHIHIHTHTHTLTKPCTHTCMYGENNMELVSAHTESSFECSAEEYSKLVHSSTAVCSLYPLFFLLLLSISLSISLSLSVCLS